MRSRDQKENTGRVTPASNQAKGCAASIRRTSRRRVFLVERSALLFTLVYGFRRAPSLARSAGEVIYTPEASAAAQKGAIQFWLKSQPLDIGIARRSHRSEASSKRIRRFMIPGFSTSMWIRREPPCVNFGPQFRARGSHSMVIAVTRPISDACLDSVAALLVKADLGSSYTAFRCLLRVSLPL